MKNDDKDIKVYRSIPFWSWNDKLEIEELIKQIHWMKKCGMGGFFMHARSGLQTEYLSEEWMKCIEACADEAQKHHMKAWVYDENGWPSGFAGMQLLEKEEYRDKYIQYKIGAYDGKADVSYLMTDNKIIRTVVGEEGEYLNLYIRTSTSTADILNPEVVEQFLALTHQQYKKRFGENFAEKIEGFFTDEPQYYRWSTPYTVMIERYFKEQFNEDILDSLGLLFVEKEGYRKFRYRYWKGMQELMLKNFAEKIYNWCTDNGVQLTGHFVEETSLAGQMMCCGGIMPFYEYEHIPGIDWLGRGSIDVGVLPIKQVGSVAAQLGRKQVLTESFGCCGWDVTPTELKIIAGYQYINGVNVMCHHLVPYSERGNRKYDYPAHYSPTNPWVKEGFKEFNDYFTNLGFLLGEGKQYVNVAVLHPIRSTYFDYKREMDQQGYGIGDIEYPLHHVCNLLSRRNIEFHFIDETLMQKYGFVDGAKIGCGACTYDYLILPSLITMDKSTENYLHQFCKNGGKVLMLGDKPTFCEAEPYEYDYLENTCSLEEIAAAQIYRNTNPETDICATYRTNGDRQFLYVLNASYTEVQRQTFDFGENIHSFLKVNLLESSTEQIPLTITLRPGEDALLIPSEKVVEDKKELDIYEFEIKDSTITWDKNYLPIDTIRYSTDGKNYSEPWPCAAIFQKLIKEKYEGSIFFQYEFEVKVLPEQIQLRTESVNEVQAWFNGLSLTEKLPVEESYISLYDITSMIQEGKNEYTVEVKWHEDESVYHALYGEDVTEALKNCIVYDSELQPIQLEGRFGVYPTGGYWEDENTSYVSGADFYIGEIPEKITELVTDGFPFFAGSFSISQTLCFENNRILLRIPGDYQMAKVDVNGMSAGTLLFEKELDISDMAQVGENLIRVQFFVSNRNLMGPHHFVDSKYPGATPWMFELSNTWEENKSTYYHDHFDLKKFKI